MSKTSSHSAGFWVLFFKLVPKLLKFVKFGKLALAGGFIGAYSFLFSWQFAVLLFLTIYIHEWGHLITMRRAGLKTRGIYMLPFVGGVALAGERFPTQKAESYIAMGGPVMGLGMAAIALVLYVTTHQELFIHSALWIAVINLFNLIPIYPLDGGRVTKSVTVSLHGGFGRFMLVLMGIAGIIVAYWYGIGLLGFLGGLTLFESVLTWFKSRDFGRYSEWSDSTEKALSKLRGISADQSEALLRYQAETELVGLKQKIDRAREAARPEEVAPVMDAKEIWLSLLLYAGTAALLVVIMRLASTVVDGSVAFELFK
jgi:Zn-dependent protease